VCGGVWSLALGLWGLVPSLENTKNKDLTPEMRIGTARKLLLIAHAI